MRVEILGSVRGIVFKRSIGAVACAISLFSIGYVEPARSDTLPAALAYAYSNNPTLNAQRAQLRATDEGVPQALSGFRPKIDAEATAGSTHTNVNPGGSASFSPLTIGISITQPIFAGFRNINNTKAAEANVQGGRFTLVNTEQNVLYQAAETYMNVVRDTAIVELRKQNVDVLTEQLRATRDRFDVGELTRTDVAQAEARLSGSRSQVNAAAASLLASRAIYRQVVGRDPGSLAPGAPLGVPARTLQEALSLGRKSHPAIRANQYYEEAAAYVVKTAEGALLPSVSLRATADHSTQPTAGIQTRDSVSILGVLSVPIYQGGGEYADVRQAKEIRAQRALEIDVARLQVEAAILSAWGALEAATALISSADSQIRAAQIALDGVREEAEVGQRTTLDVLNAQQELLDARVSRIIAQRDQVVASYALMSAIGRLTAENLRLAVATYRPEVHYEKVRDKWFGLRTPDGQ